MKLKPTSLLAMTLCTTSHALAVSPLETAVLKAVREARFDRVIDLGPASEDNDIKPGSAKTIAHTPNVDVAVSRVIGLDWRRLGRKFFFGSHASVC